MDQKLYFEILKKATDTGLVRDVNVLPGLSAAEVAGVAVRTTTEANAHVIKSSLGDLAVGYGHIPVAVEVEIVRAPGRWSWDTVITDPWVTGQPQYQPPKSAF